MKDLIQKEGTFQEESDILRLLASGERKETLASSFFS